MRLKLPLILGTLAAALGAQLLLARGQRPPNIPDNMKHYFFGLVVPGPKFKPSDITTMNDVLLAHLAWIRKETEAKKILLAGPLLGTDPKRHGMAICIVNATTKEEAKAILADDPEAKEGRFEFELQPAYLADLSSYKITYSDPPSSKR